MCNTNTMVLDHLGGGHNYNCKKVASANTELRFGLDLEETELRDHVHAANSIELCLSRTAGILENIKCLSSFALRR